MASAAGEPPATTTKEAVLLLVPRVDATFHAALRSRFHVLDYFASSSSGGDRQQPLPAFLAAAAAGAPTPPRATLMVGAGQIRVDAAFLDAVPSLRFVMCLAAGVDFIDLAACASRGVAVANSGAVFSADVADHAVGLLVDVLRRVSATDRLVRRRRGGGHGQLSPPHHNHHHHHHPPLGSTLAGRRVGVVGLGNIGSQIAKRLRALGCTVVGYTARAPKDTVPYRFFHAAGDLAAASDVLVVACALNAATRHIVGKDVLAALGTGGVVVNISRGACVDEAALVAALRDGRIAGAGLDVFEKEPGGPRELFDMENVVMTPHSAVFTAEGMADLRDHAVANLEAFFSGRPLLYMHARSVAPVIVFTCYLILFPPPSYLWLLPVVLHFPSRLGLLA